MKRFYKAVTSAAENDRFAIQLDGRPVKTPARNPLHLPTYALADAIVAEWEAQGEDIDPVTMPLTALAQGAPDQVANGRKRILGRITAFADSDRLYYRAFQNQQTLADHQVEQRGPLLDWS